MKRIFLRVVSKINQCCHREERPPDRRSRAGSDVAISFFNKTRRLFRFLNPAQSGILKTGLRQKTPRNDKSIFLRWFLVVLLSTFAFSQNDSLSISEHLVMGNPSNATASLTSVRNYLMIKPQFVHSYNRFHGIPNWVAWHVDSNWLGEINRSNNFRADSTLPEKWYHVSEKSYRRSGYDRGHMCPSGDRTNTQQNNSMTFLMTNMIPQAPNNNQGPWAALEIYCRDLVKQGNELYIYSGGNGEQGYLDSGRVQIPALTWKAILVLNSGNDDVKRVSSATRTIAVVMPNNNSLIEKHEDWKKFRVSVDSIESLTGYDFFSSVPKKIQSIIERSIDLER